MAAIPSGLRGILRAEQSMARMASRWRKKSVWQIIVLARILLMLNVGILRTFNIKGDIALIVANWARKLIPIGGGAFRLREVYGTAGSILAPLHEIKHFFAE